MTAAEALAPAEAYALWAATYDGENVVSALDEGAVRALTPPLAERALLDAACGTARRLRFGPGPAPRLAAGVDLVLEMLLRARTDPARERRLAAGELGALPFLTGRFDVAWCRLAVGHVRDLGPLYRELGRVVAPGGVVVVTDFHPEAARAGHVRSFRDSTGTVRRVEHHVHERPAHVAAAARAGLEEDGRLETGAGPEVRELYAAAGALDRWERDSGRPLLAAFRFRKGAGR